VSSELLAAAPETQNSNLDRAVAAIAHTKSPQGEVEAPLLSPPTAWPPRSAAAAEVDNRVRLDGPAR
jgi:hypothetical protein